MQGSEIERSPLLDQWDTAELRHSFVWEDYACLSQALSSCHLKPRHILSIGSAGDNALALLLANPEKLTVVDLSVAQTALVELKKAAVSVLPHAQYMGFFTGRATVMYRLSTYAQLRPKLGRITQFYWDRNQDFLLDGIDGQGRIDKYFVKFRQQALPTLWQADDLEAMVNAKDLQTQQYFWSKADPKQIEQVAGRFFSTSALSLEGRDPIHFRQVTKKEISGIFLHGFTRLMQTQLIRENPYLYYFLTGQPLVGPCTHPLWNPESYATIQKNIGALQVVNRDLESLMTKTTDHYDFMNLSDIFEYLHDVQAAKLTELLASRLTPGGVMAHWNLLVGRPATGPGLIPESATAAEISRRDRTWFYSGFHLVRRELT